MYVVQQWSILTTQSVNTFPMFPSHRSWRVETRKRRSCALRTSLRCQPANMVHNITSTDWWRTDWCQPLSLSSPSSPFAKRIKRTTENDCWCCQLVTAIQTNVLSASVGMDEWKDRLLGGLARWKPTDGVYGESIAPGIETGKDRRSCDCAHSCRVLRRRRQVSWGLHGDGLCWTHRCYIWHRSPVVCNHTWRPQKTAEISPPLGLGWYSTTCTTRYVKTAARFQAESVFSLSTRVLYVDTNQERKHYWNDTRFLCIHSKDGSFHPFSHGIFHWCNNVLVLSISESVKNSTWCGNFRCQKRKLIMTIMPMKTTYI